MRYQASGSGVAVRGSLLNLSDSWIDVSKIFGSESGIPNVVLTRADPYSTWARSFLFLSGVSVHVAYFSGLYSPSSYSLLEAKSGSSMLLGRVKGGVSVMRLS